MTFSILATDDHGAAGMAVTSSSPAVGARCIHLRPGVGAAASQNVTDPQLGTALLDALESGLSPSQAMQRVVQEHRFAEYRQLAVLGLNGAAAAFSGEECLGIHHHRVGSGVVTAGNMLATRDVVDAAVDAFEGAGGELEERLLAALSAGLEAGGEAGPLHSAGLAVVREAPWRETDLRVDWSDAPLAALSDLVALWLPQRDDYVRRALDPAGAPPYVADE